MLLEAVGKAHEFNRSTNGSDGSTDCGTAKTGALAIARRLSWFRHVPHDGGSAATWTRRRFKARQLFLEASRVQPDARRMDWLFVARPDPAVVFLHGWCRSPLLTCEPFIPRPVAWDDDCARLLAIVVADPAWCLPAFRRPAANLLDVRRHAYPDRSRLSVFVSARFAIDARSVDCFRRHCRWLLAGIRAASPARPGF